MMDIPLTSLDVSGDLPPVPEYNSKSFAPPVTIQGRTVSMARKDAPPRRKPPTLTAEEENRSLSQENLSKVDTGLEEMSRPSISIVNESKSKPVKDSMTQNIPDPADLSPIVVSSPNKSRESVRSLMLNRHDALQAASVIKMEPLTAHTHEEEPVNGDSTADSEFSFVQESDKLFGGSTEHQTVILSGSLTHPVITLPDLSQTTSRKSMASGYDSEFYDAQETTTRSNVELDTILPEVQSLSIIEPETISEGVEQESIDNNSDESSIEVKPLQFHKKNLSTASAATSPVPSYGLSQKSIAVSHKKQLSLSDEILRDIEKFQPGGINYSIVPNDDSEEVSPVTPLQNLKNIDESMGAVRVKEATDHQDEISQEKSIPEAELQVAEQNSHNDSLFQDSSDDNGINEDGYPEITSIDPQGKFQGVSGSLMSRTSSVGAEIDYRPSEQRGTFSSPKEESYEAEPTEYRQDVEKDQSFIELPSSTPIVDLHERLSSPLELSPQIESDEGSFIPSSTIDSPIPGDFYTAHNQVDTTPSLKDTESSYSYQTPEHRSFRVVNDSDLDDARNELGSPNTDERPRTFHVVNDGNYSESDSDSFDAVKQEQVNQDYSVVLQDNTLSTIHSSVESGDVLSFTAKSPKGSHFSIGSSPQKPLSATPLNYTSDVDLSHMELPSTEVPSMITPQHSFLTGPEPASSMRSEHEQMPAPTVYDRRVNEVVAPVSYISQGTGRQRRPPPPDVPTRSGRSASLSQPMNTYNTVKEAVEVQPIHHEPQKSNYVEMLRLGAGTTNTNAKAHTWGLPIGISENDYAKFASSSRASYKKTPRPQKSDLKHGKIKKRQLALEVGDDDDDETLPVGGRESMELKRFETSTSLGGTSMSPSLTQPTRSPSLSSTNFSPKKDSTPTLARSGTLITDKISPQVSIGRSGTVRGGDKGHMTLFIANPDIEEESD
jgi:hypothetical protein